MNEKPKKIEQPLEQIPKPENLGKFKELLKGWRTSPDGMDYCPDCWPKYLNKIDPKIREMAKEDAYPTADLGETRKSEKGWCAICEECSKEAYTPY